ncbi:MAG: hypothetical protein MK074_04845 [Phycisphaerales bacterium]|nr:hypothetical protein [Phycisphaerales bacterium]
MTESTEDTTRDQTERIFDEALSRPPASRAEFIASACADDPDMQDEVEAMLAHYLSTHGALQEDEASHTLQSATAEDGPPTISGAEVLDAMDTDGPVHRWHTRREMAPKDGILSLLRGTLTHDARRRLTWRAESLLRAEHPALPRVLETGSIEAGRGTEVFMLHEDVGGVSPHQHGAQSVAELRRVIARLSLLCDGLEELHRRGLFHGRVASAARLADNDTLRLAEPGFAGLLAVIPPDGSELDPLPGPRHAAPEWASLPGWELDGRVDVFAVGQLLQHACDGLDHPLGIAAASLAQSCMAADRNERPRGGGELADALRRISTDDEAASADFSPKHIVAVAVLCLVSAAAGFALAAAWLWQSGPAATP